jgi:hypothetical protein
MAMATSSAAAADPGDAFRGVWAVIPAYNEGDSIRGVVADLAARGSRSWYDTGARIERRKEGKR